MPKVRSGWPGPLAAVAVLWLLLALPNYPGAMTPRAPLTFPLELPPLLILFALARGGAALALRWAVTGVLTGMAVLKLADLGAYLAYVRPFNPALDMALVPAGWRMLSGAVGIPRALGVAVALAAIILLVGALVWWAAGRLARIEPRGGRRLVLGFLLVPALLLPLLDTIGKTGPFDPPGEALTARLTYEHLRDAFAARGDLERFRAEAAADAFAALPPGQILGALRGTDVFVIFVESYGRTALDNPLYGPTVTATLADAQTRLATAGLGMRSAWLTAPMVGGQSWLAHGSLLSGLLIGNDGRYRALMASPRKTLARLAQSAGWRSVAVMPAITLDWPEAAFFGYDQILAAKDLGYAGLPFNWVTMPDQFALASFERQSLDPSPRPPVFAEIALISSHAPWTPIPPLLPWETLGDGHVFDAAAVAGDAPEVIWRDQTRVRDQYRQSLDYSIRTVASFAERRATSAPLMIILGDHQPASFVSEGIGGQDVPVHIVGAPRDLARLDGWGWTDGLLPGPSAPVWPMDRFRDSFLAAFATPENQIGLYRRR